MPDDPRDKITVEPTPGRVVIALCGPSADLSVSEARLFAARVWEAADDAEEIGSQEQMS
jgi:hypothetical protein